LCKIYMGYAHRFSSLPLLAFSVAAAQVHRRHALGQVPRELYL
jgi:hypothetical protein